MKTKANKAGKPIGRCEFRSGPLDGPRLLEAIWPNPVCRPSMRWLKDQEKQLAIPFIRAGRFVFFDPDAVRSALAEKTVLAKDGK